jgi:ribosomal protein L24
MAIPNPPVDDAGNVRVDHVWGNIPMQPNDARGENVLDPALDNHNIVYSGWNGFPGYEPNNPVYQDLIPNVAVPNVVGETQSDAEDAIEDADLLVGDTVYVAAGATVANDGTVKSQSPAAGTVVNEGTSVTLTVYEAPAVPDVVGDDAATAEAAIEAAGLVYAEGTTTTAGADAENDGTVASVVPAAGTLVDTGSTVTVSLYEFLG